MKFYILILIALLATGCSKYLETDPDLRTELDDATKIGELLTSAYPRANYITFMESASDNADDKGAAAGSGDAVNKDPWMFKDVQDVDEDSPTYYWYGAYKAIAAANQALKAIEDLGTPKETLSMKGEALLARAYAHHMLVSLFSKFYVPGGDNSSPGIPYVLKPEREVITKYDRSTVEEIYRLIDRDINEGLPLLDDNRYRVPKYHFTTTSAHAFATRFYLFKGDYEKAIIHANAAMGENIGAAIRPVNSAAFRAMEYYSRQLWYTSTSNPSNLLLAESKSVWGRSLAPYRYGLTFPLFAELIFADNVSGGSYSYTVYGGTEMVYNIPKFSETFITESINAEYGDAYNMIPLFTADELLLNRAEIYAKLNQFDNSVKDLHAFASKKVYASQNNPVYNPTAHAVTLAKVNAFYGSENTQQNLIKAVLDFKRREFLFEGLRWFDILRYNIVVTHNSHDKLNTYVLGVNDPMRMFQLPEEVVLSGVQKNPR